MQNNQNQPQPVELGPTTRIIITEGGVPTGSIEVSFSDLVEVELLGRGAFGFVHKMRHRPTGLILAVKTITQPWLDEQRQRPTMDLQAHQRLGNDCPHLVSFYGALHAEGYLRILTEVMDTCLDRFYKKAFTIQSQMPESLLSKTAHAVLSALEYMRTNELMHRDIKPSNILINATGEIKVCDFGISRNAIGDAYRTHVGCAKYMSPERIRPENGYSINADIWSLGISLIEMAEGAHPFGQATGIIPLMRCITVDDSPKLDVRDVDGNHTFSAAFRSFVDKCLIREADERPNSADLLNEEFITRHIAEPLDLELLRTVVDA